MDSLIEEFDAHLDEITSYLEFLELFEKGISGNSKIFKELNVYPIHQRISYSSVFLQLYNLVEATLSKCTHALSEAIVQGNDWKPKDLSEELQKEWVRYFAKTHLEQNHDNRLRACLNMFNHLVETLSIDSIKIEKGNSGNWDDEYIYDFAKRLGCSLQISSEANKNVKQNFREDRGALKFIVKIRNDLAHGQKSFAECGADFTVSELKALKLKTEVYMREVVLSFSEFIKNYSFLQPKSRPLLDIIK